MAGLCPHSSKDVHLAVPRTSLNSPSLTSRNSDAPIPRKVKSQIIIDIPTGVQGNWLQEGASQKGQRCYDPGLLACQLLPQNTGKQTCWVTSVWQGTQ